MPDPIDNSKLLGGRGYPRQNKWFKDQLEMTHTFANLTEPPSAPSGYKLRQYRPEDEASYLTLFGLAFENQDVLPNTLKRQLKDGFFVVEQLSNGALVASTVAEKPPARYPIGGELGWVVTDPEHAGKGLGTLVVAAVTERLHEEGYKSGYLSTDDFRFAAISIYLKLGWQPRLQTENMKDRWQFIYEKLGLESKF